MPVEERLRSALADQAATVRADVEGPLERVRRRRTRRLTAWSVVTAAAVVALGAGVTAVVAPEPAPPSPMAPAGEHGDAPPPKTLATGTFTRQVRADEARAAGFSRREVRDLFHRADEVTAVMTFLEQRDPQSGLQGWRLWFLGEDGERQIRDGGGYFHEADGDLRIVSKGIGCLGCSYRFGWDLRRGRLTLSATADSQVRPMAELLGSGSWQRR